MKKSKIIEEYKKQYWTDIGIEQSIVEHIIKEGKAKNIIDYFEKVDRYLSKNLAKALEAQKAKITEKAKGLQAKIHGGGNGRRIMEEFINLIKNE